MNVVPFKLKDPVGKLPKGRGMIFYDREIEAIRIAADFDGDEAILINESPQTTDLPQKSISRIHFQKALFGGGSIVIRLRNGRKSEWYQIFKEQEFELPISKRNLEKAEELVTEVKFDLFEDSLDDMLDFTDETLGYKDKD